MIISDPNSFSHGYLITDAEISGDMPGWKRESFGQLSFFSHGKTVYSMKSSSDNGIQVLVVGNPVDLEANTIDADRVTEISLGIVIDKGVEALVDYVSYLGGRFSFFISLDGQLIAIPDCHATQSIFWHAGTDGISLASHSRLAALPLGLEPDEYALELLSDLKAKKSQGTRYFPGTRTAYTAVQLVFANCLLSVDLLNHTGIHTRFYPRNEIADSVSYEDTYSRFENLFLKHVSLLCKFGETAISLTSGKDSAATLAAVKRDGTPDVFTFTFFQYLNAGVASGDLFGANESAFRANLRHRVIRWSPYIHSKEFDAMYNETWPHAGQSPSTARCMYEELPHDFYQLQSTIAETGTAFYKGRKNRVISPARLTALWQGSAIAEDQRFVDEFSTYIDYSDFNETALMNIDYHDAFYWEHRNTSWAANRYHEGDLGHRVLLPFNQREIVESMLSLPVEDRRSARILLDFVARNPF